MDRVQVVVVVESHTDNALPLGSFNSLPSSMPQQLGTPLLSLGRNTEGNQVFLPSSWISDLLGPTLRASCLISALGQ